MKFMNTKRFASTVMAGVLTLSLAAPAFAASTQPKNSTVVTGAYKEIPIAVEVPTTGTAQINPYGLPVTITKSDEKTVDLVSQKITTRPLSIKNQGSVDLDLGVSSFVVVPKGDVSIATTADTDKAIKVDLEVAALDDAALALSTENEKLGDLLIDKFAADATWTGAGSLGAPAAAKGDTAADITAEKTTNPLATLGAATVKGDLITYGNDSIALFRLKGDLAQEPTSGAWKDTDGFEATIVFKFTPATPAPSAGDAAVTLNNATLTLDNTTTTSGTLNATFAAGTSGLTVASYAWSVDDTTVATIGGSTTATETVTYAGAGAAVVTCTVTLSNGATVSATCDVTCS